MLGEPYGAVCRAVWLAGRAIRDRDEQAAQAAVLMDDLVHARLHTLAARTGRTDAD